MTPLPLALAIALALAPDSGVPAGPRTFTVSDGSTVTYLLVHKFHAIEGSSKAVEGKARWLPDGTVQVMVRARVDSFDSGNSNRDAHMKEVTEAHRLPFVLFKAVAEGIRVERFPSDFEIPLRGVLEFHGVTREIAVTARVHLASPERAAVEATFPVSLTAHGVERPSLLFVKVDDRIEIGARLALTLEPN
jgi:polyisoprenoid-binding protein YceI